MFDPDLQSLTRPPARPRAAISPLSAATLLLLVSLVVSSSPAIRGGQVAADLRPASTKSVAISEDRTDDDQRSRQAAPQSQDADQAGNDLAPWAALADGEAVESTAVPTAIAPMLVREALLNLPPPRA